MCVGVPCSFRVLYPCLSCQAGDLIGAISHPKAKLCRVWSVVFCFLSVQMNLSHLNRSMGVEMVQSRWLQLSCSGSGFMHFCEPAHQVPREFLTPYDDASDFLYWSILSWQGWLRQSHQTQHVETQGDSMGRTHSLASLVIVWHLPASQMGVMKYLA